MVSSETTAKAASPDAKNGGLHARRVTSRPIGFYLILLVGVILLPALAFTVILLERTGSAQRDRIETLAGATAGSISQAVDREILGMLTTLRVLSTAESLERDNFASFHARARLALREREAHVILIDENDNQVLNTRVAYGTALGRTSDPQSARAARESAGPIVSNAFYGATANRWVFNVLLPIEHDGRRWLLVMTQDAANLIDVMSQQNLRGGWNVSLIDQMGTVLASTYLSSDTGKPFFLGVDPQNGRARGQIVRDSPVELFSVVTQGSEMSGWKVVVWAPASVIDGPLRRSMTSLLLGGLAVGVLASMAAWLLSRQISQPIRRLARDAGRLGSGEEVVATAYPVAEISTVSRALAVASADRRAAENEIRFLMREVAHRSKNQLTVVASIAKQSARNARSFANFQDAFQKRILGLARSTDLLIAGGVAGVDLHELFAAQIEPFKPADAARVELSGPAFRLDNQAAQTLGLAAHELATNAAKYGAFAKTNGRLSVTWRIDGERLVIVWREHAGRLARRPVTRGFGSEVIERMVGGTLDAEIDRTIHADGLECSFSIPLDKVRAEAPLRSAAATA